MRIVKRTVSALKTFATRFANDRRGNIAMMFALALPPLLLTTLGAIDIARVSTVHVKLQDALDAATLAAARSRHTDNINIQEVGYAALRANLPAWDDVTLDAAKTTFTLNAATGTVAGDASVNVKTLVANIILPPYGQFVGDQVPVNAHSEVQRATGGLIEVALVIDNTLSMNGAKIANTKAAAIDLIDRLETASKGAIEEDAIKIALVPFSQTVRVTAGGTNTVPGWMTNATAHTGGGVYANPGNPYSMFDSNAQGRFTLFSRLNTTWGGCVEARGAPYDIRDTAPITGIEASQFVPYFAPDEPDKDDYPGDATWQGYNIENDYIDDGVTGTTTADPFGTGTAAVTAREEAWFQRMRLTSRYQDAAREALTTDFGPNKGCGLQPIIRLTDDFDALRTAVNNMSLHLWTNIPFGTMWGWHTLSPNAPFGDGRAYGTERLKKVIIIMTDGENAVGRESNPNEGMYTGIGHIWQNRLGITTGTNLVRRRSMDGRLDSAIPGTEDLCGNMKDKDIVVYTIAVQVSAGVKTMLQRCATNSDHYFPVESASGIGDAFQKIASSIANMRITR